MKIYEGGSDKDELIYDYAISALTLVKSYGNQIFISFTTDGKGVDKGFTAKFTFGNLILYIISEIEYLLYISIFSSCLR